MAWLGASMLSSYSAFLLYHPPASLSSLPVLLFLVLLLTPFLSGFPVFLSPALASADS